MTAAALPRDAFMPHAPPGTAAGMVLALIAHALLVVALAFSVSWRSSVPDSVEAELWAAVPQIAAPPPPPPPPVVQTKPPPPALQPRPVQQALPDAQIAIEKARREEVEKREAEKRELARAQAERKKRELAAKQQAEKDAELVEAQRQANLKRMLGQAGATGDAATPGTAAQSAGPSAGYAGRIKAAIKPNILFTDSISGDPLATVVVRLAPDGTIMDRNLLKSSGVKAWDEAVLRAIDKTGSLPRDRDGRVPPVIEIDFKPRD